MAQRVGRVIAGRYWLIEVLGRGGMGTVWRAHDNHLRREVAAKECVLPTGATDSEREVFCARTIREARSAARLRHPGIVTIHDHFDQDGSPWIIMELVPGRSLADEIEQAPLPPMRVAEIGRQMLEALCIAHRNGVVHRDIKPSNVLLEGDKVFLTDFGIAAIDDDTAITKSGMIIGTPAYMAPEQAGGGQPTSLSDLWSLGATLYAAVEGIAPYTGPNAGAIFTALAINEPPRTRNAGVLEPVIRGLLCKDPDLRMQADEASRLFDDILGGSARKPAVRAGHLAPPRQGRAPTPAEPRHLPRVRRAPRNSALLAASAIGGLVATLFIWLGLSALGFAVAPAVGAITGIAALIVLPFVFIKLLGAISSRGLFIRTSEPTPTSGRDTDDPPTPPLTSRDAPSRETF
jgi:eukaryotic-like serine/threonine-protein kinase